MSKSETKVFQSCCVCGQTIADPPDAKFCSRKCQDGFDRIAGLQQDIINFVHSPDPRRFFYDVGFGELCDKFTILLIRKLHQTSPSDKLETDFYLGQVIQSINTKLNKCYLDKNSLKNVGGLIQDLYRINAKMWRARTALANGRGTPMDLTIYFETGSYNRDIYKSQLDAMIDGRARLVRIYD